MLQPLREALRAWSPESGRGDPLGDAAAAWPELVGAEIARHSRPAQITGETLVVATRSSSWSEQLSFLSEEILRALRETLGLKTVKRLSFRTGSVTKRSRHGVIRGVIAPRRNGAARREVAASMQESLERFRSAVRSAQRAKAASGSKECRGCAALIAPDRAMCAACENRFVQERERLVSRLLFDVPWLGYDGIAALVEGLRREEYESIRMRLLARWWAILDRARRTQRLSSDGRERLVASSYVIVKSGVAPENIAPATVRNVLGDELADLLKNGDGE